MSEAGRGNPGAGSLELVPVVVGSHKAGHMLEAELVGLCETSVELVAQPSHQVDRICHPSCPALPCVASANCQLVFNWHFINTLIFSTHS
jgi:hypothetical protein